MKSVCIWSYSGPHFPASEYSVRMWENTDGNNFKYGHFLRSDIARDHYNCQRKGHYIRTI